MYVCMYIYINIYICLYMYIYCIIPLFIFLSALLVDWYKQSITAYHVHKHASCRKVIVVIRRRAHYIHLASVI